jgi:hypothetical protein
MTLGNCAQKLWCIRMMIFGFPVKSYPGAPTLVRFGRKLAIWHLIEIFEKIEISDLRFFKSSSNSSKLDLFGADFFHITNVEEHCPHLENQFWGRWRQNWSRILHRKSRDLTF